MPSTAADWLYRALYGGVLSRLPEPTALALGQAGLRLLPLDRLGPFRSRDPRLAVMLGGVRLGNPLILSSMYYDTAILRRAMGLGFGAVTTKSITRTPRPGHPEPNLVRRWSAEGPGLVNCNGFKNPGLDAYRADLPALPHRTPLIVAVAGSRRPTPPSSTSGARSRRSCAPSSGACGRRRRGRSSSSSPPISRPRTRVPSSRPRSTRA
ncbi:MAG: hypothetical protein DME06_19170 [Candidatus Rokuibacteriota bacterium]|nr:MAG: hypothetical protein DME06_19170 [Candidatus Rokubacteria bacterium]